MIPHRRLALALLTTLACTPAFAQDDLLDDEPDDEKALDDIDDNETLLEDDDILDGDDGPQGDSDTSQTYRMAQEEVAGLAPDEERMFWNDYLDEYPKTVYAQRIGDRIQKLADLEYANIDTVKRPGKTNNDSSLIDLATPMLLENMEPRDRLMLGVGFGGTITFLADFEKSIIKPLSIHAGIRTRYTGINVELGAKYAIVRAVRTKTLFTGMFDVHVNTGPVFVGFRPQLAFGKRLGIVDLQAQVGVDIAPRSYVVTGDVTQPILDLRYIGGLNVTVRPEGPLDIFAEASFNMKSAGDYTYSFNVVTIGMKFTPQKLKKGDMEVNVGASAPFANSYWGYYLLEGLVQMNYYPEFK